MEPLINTTNDSNMLPMVKNGKCLGCNDTTKDIDVLCCYLCKNHFHVLHCPVVEVMPTDVLPSKTDRGNYIKFCKKTFSTGNFIWTQGCIFYNFTSVQNQLSQETSCPCGNSKPIILKYFE